MNICKHDSNYTKYIEVEDNSNYSILANKLNDGDSIQCPNDPTMTIAKRGGKIFMKKTGYGSINVEDSFHNK